MEHSCKPPPSGSASSIWRVNSILPIRIVLVRPQGAMNVGLICRAAANMAVEDIRLVSPQFDLEDKALRQYALHAHKQRDGLQVVSNLQTACEGADFIVGTSADLRNCESIPRLSVPDIHQRVSKTHSQSLALVFGNEAAGLSNEELSFCQACLQLEMPGEFKSFNLSHAVAITLYLLRQEPDLPPAADPLATPAELAHLHAIWLDALDKQEYFQRLHKSRFAPKLQRLLDRIELRSRDIKGLYGMFRHFARHDMEAKTESKP